SDSTGIARRPRAATTPTTARPQSVRARPLPLAARSAGAMQRGALLYQRESGLASEVADAQRRSRRHFPGVDRQGDASVRVTLRCHGLVQACWFRDGIAGLSYRDQSRNAVLGERLAKSGWVKSVLLPFAKRQSACPIGACRDGEGCQLH